MEKSETVLRVEAMDILINKLGEVDAERFISLIKTDNFDYTKWRQGLWPDKTIDEIHHLASEYEKNH
ncbi:MAG: hypothetical protein LBQ83_04215 [Candidatus Margulisbacteria bacterium]|jgi:hypothetical protein|nr:hypothetical protein [Candidatus Margulisiibacteriota bacterium]